MSATAQRQAPRAVDYEDVDDIIGIAAEMQDLERERLSVEDLNAVARDLDIPEQYLRPAIAELRRRRDAELAVDAARRRRRTILTWVAVALVAALLIWGFSAHSRLVGLAAAAAQARAQVVNVTQRQAATRAQWERGPEGPERAAELSGAENRVRIERQRYDAAVTAYNTAAGAFPTVVVRALLGHPATLPLSNELSRF